MSNKFLKESSCDLFRETHTIMAARIQDTLNSKFKDEARFYGVYAGDRAFRSFEVRPAAIGSYVSYFKSYSVRITHFHIGPQGERARPSAVTSAEGFDDTRTKDGLLWSPKTGLLVVAVS
ncbi:unnamed protein product [Mortierella alpina]